MDISLFLVLGFVSTVCEWMIPTQQFCFAVKNLAVGTTIYWVKTEPIANGAIMLDPELKLFAHINKFKLITSGYNIDPTTTNSFFGRLLILSFKVISKFNQIIMF